MHLPVHKRSISKATVNTSPNHPHTHTSPNQPHTHLFLAAHTKQNAPTNTHTSATHTHRSGARCRRIQIWMNINGLHGTVQWCHRGACEGYIQWFNDSMNSHCCVQVIEGWSYWVVATSRWSSQASNAHPACFVPYIETFLNRYKTAEDLPIETSWIHCRLFVSELQQLRYRSITPTFDCRNSRISVMLYCNLVQRYRVCLHIVEHHPLQGWSPVHTLQQADARYNREAPRVYSPVCRCRRRNHS